MAIQLSTVITAARNKHPAFDSTRVPNTVLASCMSDYQNTLIGKAVARDKHYLAQRIAVALAVDDANDPNVAGVNTTGGVPGSVSSGSISPVRESAGRLVTVDPDATVHLAERIVTSATDTTTTSTGAARSVNADAGRLLVIVQGKGAGQVRKVTSNTADTWTHAAWSATPGYVTPNATSVMKVVAEAVEADGTAGVQTEIPAQSPRSSYLVRLNAAGVAYIDYTKPLTAWVDRGIPLPSLVATLGGTVRFTGSGQEELCITTFARRFDPPWVPAVYFASETLHLCGDADEWTDVESLEVLYTPVAPSFAALADYFLVPDAARAVLVAYAAAFAAERVAGFGVQIDVGYYVTAAARAENDYLSTLRLSKRARVSTMREGAY